MHGSGSPAQERDHAYEDTAYREVHAHPDSTNPAGEEYSTISDIILLH
jgi:hypothetical protein